MSDRRGKRAVGVGGKSRKGRARHRQIDRRICGRYGGPGADVAPATISTNQHSLVEFDCLSPPPHHTDAELPAGGVVSGLRARPITAPRTTCLPVVWFRPKCLAPMPTRITEALG